MNDTQYETVNLRVTKEQKAQMSRNAAKHGMSLSAFLRFLALNYKAE